MLIEDENDDWCVSRSEKISCEIEFLKWTSTTSSKILNVFLVYLLSCITLLIWNNWWEGVDGCGPRRIKNLNWFFVVTGDGMARTDSELFFVYLVLFVHNKPIWMSIEGHVDDWSVGWSKELFVEIEFSN